METISMYTHHGCNIIVVLLMFHLQWKVVVFFIGIKKYDSCVNYAAVYSYNDPFLTFGPGYN